MAVPDLLAIATILVEKRGWFLPPNTPWVGAIYGGQKDEWDFHKAGFTEPWLIHILELAGFTHSERVRRFDTIGIADTSYSPIPFGKDISLNVMAVNEGVRRATGLPNPTTTERGLVSVGRGLEFAMKGRSALQSRLALRRLEKHASGG